MTARKSASTPRKRKTRASPPKAGKPKPPGLTITAYAKRRGVSRIRIQKLVKDGTITLNAAGRIDPDRADQEIATGLDPAFSHLGPLENPGPGRPNTGTAAPQAIIARRKAQAFREHFLAKTAELEYQERAGKLIDKAEVRQAFFVIARQARDSLLHISARVSSLLAAESDEAKVRAILDAEVRRALQGFIDADPEQVFP